jgi:DNA-binding NarL/FixJ family response regulator
MIHILLIESQSRIRQGLRMRLAIEADVQVIGEASDSQSAMQMAQAYHPNVIIIEVAPAILGCFSAIRSLHEQMPETKIIALSLYDDETTRSLARLAGASDFVAKSSGPQALLRAIRKSVEQPVDQ